MSTTKRTEGGIMSRLGFDVLAHLEAMRGTSGGIRNIDVQTCKQAPPAALRVWEDCNFPYRLPADLRAFLGASNAFSLTWTADQRSQPLEGGGVREGETVVGRIRVNALSAITRVPLDADDLRDMAASRARAAAAAAAAAAKARSVPRHRCSPRSSRAGGTDNNESSIRAEDGRDGRAGHGQAGVAAASPDAPSLEGIETDGWRASSSAYGIAAFCLDSACEVGRVALVYGGIPVAENSHDDGHVDSSVRVGSGTNSSNASVGDRGRDKPPAARELSNPEVWLQDLSCRWHYLADSFTCYFRMMVVHLGVLGWQQAFTPVGLSPNTEQCMRLYCPDRLLYDHLAWEAERADTKASRKAPLTFDGDTPTSPGRSASTKSRS